MCPKPITPSPLSIAVHRDFLDYPPAHPSCIPTTLVTPYPRLPSVGAQVTLDGLSQSALFPCIDADQEPELWGQLPGFIPQLCCFLEQSQANS